MLEPSHLLRKEEKAVGNEMLPGAEARANCFDPVLVPLVTTGRQSAGQVVTAGREPKEISSDLGWQTQREALIRNGSFGCPDVNDVEDEPRKREPHEGAAVGVHSVITGQLRIEDHHRSKDIMSEDTHIVRELRTITDTIPNRLDGITVESVGGFCQICRHEDEGPKGRRAGQGRLLEISKDLLKSTPLQRRLHPRIVLEHRPDHRTDKVTDLDGSSVGLGDDAGLKPALAHRRHFRHRSDTLSQPIIHLSDGVVPQNTGNAATFLVRVLEDVHNIFDGTTGGLAAVRVPVLFTGRCEPTRVEKRGVPRERVIHVPGCRCRFLHPRVEDIPELLALTAEGPGVVERGTGRSRQGSRVSVGKATETTAPMAAKLAEAFEVMGWSTLSAREDLFVSPDGAVNNRVITGRQRPRERGELQQLPREGRAASAPGQFPDHPPKALRGLCSQRGEGRKVAYSVGNGPAGSGGPRAKVVCERFQRAYHWLRTDANRRDRNPPTEFRHIPFRETDKTRLHGSVQGFPSRLDKADPRALLLPGRTTDVFKERLPVPAVLSGQPSSSVEHGRRVGEPETRSPHSCGPEAGFRLLPARGRGPTLQQEGYR
uniref:RNA-dependent RNA polymerase n=1 Tax=Fushun narnavirus 2 TaxID=2905334 RepID=A0A8K1XHR6_9VIRU|nr:MAG: RNA-dependent RNA polymerase [Fushun narnavirus 2]